MREVLIITTKEFKTKVLSKAYLVSCLITGIMLAAVVFFVSIGSSSINANVGMNMLSPSMQKQIQIQTEAQANVYKELGITPEAFTQLVKEEVTKLNADSAQPAKDAESTYWIGYISSMFIYIAIMITGSSIAQSVAEEKTSSIVEVILGTTSSTKLMAGKVIGSGLAGICQMLLMVVPPLAVAGLTNSLAFLGNFNLGLIGLVVALFFIIGYLSYAALLAASAATVKRMQDVQNAIVPVSMLAMVGFFVSLAGTTGGAAKVLQFIPLIAPFSAPTAFARGDMQLGEAIISIVISAVFLPVIFKISGKFYDSSILNANAGKFSFKALFTK